MNVAYKHLDARLRIAELSIGQWTVAVLGVMIAAAWVQLSPFGTFVSLFMAVYFASLPIGGAFFASYTDFDLMLFARSALAWRRCDGRVIAGPGTRATGYVVVDESDDESRAAESEDASPDLSRLWAV
jgi:hypothetical protein